MLCRSFLAAAILPVLSLAKSLPAKTIGQLSVGTWFENIAVRPNGDLLLTQLHPEAIVYTIENPSARGTALKELVPIPAVQNIYGIAQVPQSNCGSETFILVGGNSTAIGSPIVGTFSAWAIEFHGSKSGDAFSIRQISKMDKQSSFLNGVTAIPGVSDAVLVADSAKGLVGRLDLSTGAFDTSAFVFPEMVPLPGAALPIGVNGIHIKGGYLYFTNSFVVSIYRVAITPSGFPHKGAKPELVIDLSDKAKLLDDFIFDDLGNIYAATNVDNKIVFFNPKSGESNVVVGGTDEMTVAGDTAVAFGRGKHDKDTLYVVTSGAIPNPVGGTKTEGAKVVAIDTDA